MSQVNDCLAAAASGEVGANLFYCQLVEDLRNLMKKKEQSSFVILKSLFFSPAVSFSQIVSVVEMKGRTFQGQRYQRETDIPPLSTKHLTMSDDLIHSAL